MAALPPLYYTSPRGQCAVMLLAALHEMFLKDAMATATKREAILRIKMNHWFDLHEEDLEPYPSQRLLREGDFDNFSRVLSSQSPKEV